MSKLEELFLTKKELEKKKKNLMADGGGGAGGGGGGGGAGGGAGAGAGAGAGVGAGVGAGGDGGSASSSGDSGSAGSGDTGSADSTPSAPAGFYGLGTMPSRKKKKKKTHFKFGGGIYEELIPERKVFDKHYDRKELPQVNIKHLAKSDFDYTIKEMDLDEIKPVQSERVKGLVSSSEVLILNNKYKPLVVDKNGYLVNGHHRYDAAHNLEMDKISVVEVDATLEDIIDYYKELRSNTEIEEADELYKDISPEENLNFITTGSTNYKYDQWNFKTNPKMNLIDVLRLFIKDDAEEFILGGLRFDWSKKQSPDYYKYSAGRKSILLMADKIGYGEHKHVTVPKELHKVKPHPDQTELNFTDPNEPLSVSDIYQGPQFSRLEMRLGSPLFEFARIGDLIRSHANRIEKLRIPRMKLKTEIENKSPNNSGYNDKRDPDVIEYYKIKEKIDESLYLIRENIPDLVKELYKLKNLLIQKHKEGDRATPLESLDEFLKDMLDEKIERNLKSKKF